MSSSLLYPLHTQSHRKEKRSATRQYLCVCQFLSLFPLSASIDSVVMSFHEICLFLSLVDDEHDDDDDVYFPLTLHSWLLRVTRREGRWREHAGWGHSLGIQEGACRCRFLWWSSLVNGLLPHVNPQWTLSMPSFSFCRWWYLNALLCAERQKDIQRNGEKETNAAAQWYFMPIECLKRGRKRGTRSHIHWLEFQ